MQVSYCSILLLYNVWYSEKSVGAKESEELGLEFGFANYCHLTYVWTYLSYLTGVRFICLAYVILVVAT